MNERINTAFLEECLAKEKAEADNLVASGDLDARIAVFAFETQATIYRQTAVAVNAGASDDDVYSARINLIANLVHSVATDTCSGENPDAGYAIEILQQVASGVLQRIRHQGNAIALDRSGQR
ncbi:hypothetical protein [Methylobacterium aquaticum]|uniref:Uncharacterized protein n=1 Tax=Methylobacterium aquaticum TaxID=270351 RepID=A0A0J6SGD3_9HYPH|nr:hypothetical protein [Methylobacterium aquaticum]KMO34285.1 hypothetical protein VP06_14520 [Methylobacterium aquaticum]